MIQVQKQKGASMPTTDLSTRACDGYVVVALSGELDMLDAARVTAGLTSAAAREPQVIVDLADLKFIDCSGITALIRGRKLARDAGGELRLAAPRPQVLQVLTLTRLTHVTPVYASLAEAAAMAARSLAVTRETEYPGGPVSGRRFDGQAERVG